MNGQVELAQLAMGLCIGIGLSAACGFRIFVPMLFLSIAGHLGAEGGGIDLSPGWEWIGTWPAVVAFACATALEVGAYYIPWLDNLLDSVATPAAIVAGTVVTASCIGDMSPLLKWGLAIIAGGGAAGVVQGATVVTRALSSGATGGLGNPVVSTAEAGLSIGLSLLAILIPLLAVVFVLAVCVYAVRMMMRWFQKREVEDQLVPA